MKSLLITLLFCSSAVASTWPVNLMLSRYEGNLATLPAPTLTTSMSITSTRGLGPDIVWSLGPFTTVDKGYKITLNSQTADSYGIDWAMLNNYVVNGPAVFTYRISNDPLNRSTYINCPDPQGPLGRNPHPFSAINEIRFTLLDFTYGLREDGFSDFGNVAVQYNTTLELMSVPEPSTVAMLLLALAAIAFGRVGFNN